jgi:sodium-dependent dicarboxylate transporter 2/3/5
MMLPIALSVIDLVMRQHGGAPLAELGDLPAEGAPGRNFALSLMLGIAYAASIGGIGTIIGSPPNAILVEFVSETYGRDISFVEWMKFALPLVAVFLPVAWVLITWALYPIRIKRVEGGRAMFARELQALGPMKPGEWVTFIVFMVTACTWIARPWLVAWTVGEGERAWQPLGGLNDASIAIGAGLLLFAIPVRGAVRGAPWTGVLDWRTAVKLPWGVLILFGGGLSLAAAVNANGVADFLGAQVASFDGWSTLALVLAVTTLVIFLTELTSNTATTATFVPILAALAPGLGVDPYMLIVPATVAASCAFMMPVATPPNAIVFGSGYVTIPQMCKAGFWLNLCGIVLVTLMAHIIVKGMFSSALQP